MPKLIGAEVPFVRSEFNYDMHAASKESGLDCRDVSLAKQSFAEEADINTIVRRFHLTGELPQGLAVPTYQDFEGVFDFQSAMNVVRAASEAFMAMPADIRSRFENSEQKFYNFVLDEGNREEAERLGLVIGKAPAPADGAQPAQPAPATPAPAPAPAGVTAAPAGGPAPA